MTWLDVGNGWRNLFLLSCAVQALALGAGFAAHRLWVKRSRLGAFLAGAAVTPLVQMLFTLLLAFAWPRAPRLVYVGALPAAACLYLLGLGFKLRRRLPQLFHRAAAWARKACAFDKPGLIALCLAAAMAALLLPVCVRTATSTVTAQADTGEYMGLAVRYCENRDLGALLEKDETVGHFRGHSHFPSMELYLVYGLMHGSGDYGYPNDKPMFTAVGLLVFYLLAAYLALCLRFCHGRKRWLCLGLLLFNLVPNFVFCLSGAARDTWRCLAVLSGALALSGLDTAGGWRRYLLKLAWMLLLCFTVMSAHVVCFVVLPFLVAAWVLWQWLSALLAREKRAGRTLLRALGLALSGAAGTLLGFAGNLWCYLKWGEMSPWRLMTTYTSAPWYELYMQGEYKLEETTTHLDFWKAKYDVVMAYATPVGLWGMRLALLTLAAALVALVVRRARRTDLRPCGLKLTDALGVALMTLCALAPMTGLLDSKLYSFSGSFLTMQRYTLQWFMLAGVCIAAVLAAGEASWPALLAWAEARFARLRGWLTRRAGVRAALLRVPAWLCAALCALAFAQGTSERGYANSMYRYGRPLLSDESVALDNSFQTRYASLMRLEKLLAPEQKLLLTRPGYQYAIHGRGYILTANPIVPLLDATLGEVPALLAKMNVAALATEADFWDERYYARSALSEYLNALPPEQIVQSGDMRFYLVDPSLAARFQPSSGA